MLKYFSLRKNKQQEKSKRNNKQKIVILRSILELPQKRASILFLINFYFPKYIISQFQAIDIFNEIIPRFLIDFLRRIPADVDRESVNMPIRLFLGF